MPPANRSAFLDTFLADEPELRSEIELLLSSHEMGTDFIEKSALEVAASALAEEQCRAIRGKIIGRYRILESIGAGGMGEVYLAEDDSLGRKVALKVLLPAYAEKDRDSLRRFQQEARAASALSHPNTADIYEIGEADGINFIAMEYVEGELLESRINGRPLDCGELVEIGIQIADALDEAHSKGIAHRDIKSANIIITTRGRVKVLDFGLAKTPTISPGEEDAAEQVKTRTGVVLGTVSYMSPEQALGRGVDFRTDIFSLGIVLYEMATGRLPFSGPTVSATIDQIAHAQPDAIARLNYEVPEELERIIKKALRKSRDERYQTARDLLIDLKNLKQELDWKIQSQNFAAESTIGERSVFQTDDQGAASKPRNTQTRVAHTTSSAEYVIGEINRHKLGAALTFLALIAAVVLGAVAVKKYLRAGQSAEPETAQAMKTKRLITSASGGKAGNTSISPDGRFVVYKDDETDRRQALWIKQVATGAARQIVAPDDVVYRGTTFSHDGNLIYYVLRGAKYPRGALFQVPVIGGTSKQLLEGISGPISQSPDGAQFSYSYERRLMVANADGSSAHSLATIYGGGGFTPTGPAWSPDGKKIAYGSTRSDGGPYASVFTVDVGNGEVKQITNHEWSSVRRMLWFGDGNGLVVLASDPEQDFSQIWEISYPSGAVRRITNDLNGHGHISLGLTADSRTLVTQQEDETSHVWIATSGDTNNSRQVTSGEGYTDGRFGVAWSPDGSLIYSARVNTGWNLWRIKSDGTQPEPLTTDAYRDEYPVVTRDAQSIIFRSSRGTGIYHLWSMDVNGGQLKQLTTEEGAEEDTGRVSADGRWLVYSSRMAGQNRLWKVAMDGGTRVRITDYQSTSPDVSPDGKTIACIFLDGALKPAQWRVAIIPFEGGSPLKIIDLPATADIGRYNLDGRAATYVRWTNDGRALAYVDRKDGVSNIWSQPIDGGQAKQLTNFVSGWIFNFELSPDGTQIACARGNRSSDVILITDFR